MSLPILHSTSPATPQTLVRLFHQTERDWVRHVSEETALDVGTAFHNAELKRVYDVNCVLDAALPDAMSPTDALAQARTYFHGVGSILHRWVMNPSAPSEKTGPLIQHLLASGFRAQSADILVLSSAPPAMQMVGGLTIIPARASFKHSRALADEAALRWNEPALADAEMMHLDDSHWDALIALRDGVAVAGVGVLSVGEIGRIDGVFVSEKYRKLGIGRTMMARALEICARSLFKHVMLSVAQDNAAAQALYRALGFRKIGEITSYYDRSL